MLTDLLDYELPDQCIAKFPLPERDGARMLVIQEQGLEDSAVRHWPEQVPSGALVVVNDSRVIKARLVGHRRPSGGRVEILLIAPDASSQAEPRRQFWTSLGRASKPLRQGTVIDCGPLRVIIEEVRGQGHFLVLLESELPVRDAIEQVGHVPIPPYLARADEELDLERYQTVFARADGSVAAPTAGLHLSSDILAELARREVQVAAVTLHVGLGTFRPVTVDDLDNHPMHEERYEVTLELAEAIASARARGAPVIAVGTTVVRALESAYDPQRRGLVLPQTAATDLLIQPGYHFQVVDGLLTNFHMPRSTLLALVGAFIGLPRLLDAYRVAIQRGYRFLSYGDATWIPQRIPTP